MGTSINNTNEALNNNADPSLSLISLSEAIKETEIASGNIAQLDETIKLAIAKQRELLNSTDATESQDQSSHNFTYSILGLKDILLDNNKAFWGLDSITREEAVDHVQNNIDETLFLLAQNLIEGSNYSNGDFPNLGTSKCILFFRNKLWTFHFCSYAAVQVESREKTDYENKTYTYEASNKDQLILPEGFPYAVDDPTTLLSFSVYPEFQQLLHGDTLA